MLLYLNRRYNMERKNRLARVAIKAIIWPFRTIFNALIWLVASILQILKVSLGLAGVLLFGVGIFGSIASIPVAIQHGWQGGLAFLLISLVSALIGRTLTKWFLGVDPIFIN
jgi:hypothetical protein